MKVKAFYLGIQDFKKVWDIQKFIRKGIIDTGCDCCYLLLLQHNHVYTVGRNEKEVHLLKSLNVPIYHIERGGKITYHGPGQLIGYPIMKLRGRWKDLKLFISTLSASVAKVVSCLGVECQVKDFPLTGVWVGNRKIASIGLHVSRWVSIHGFALNISTDLNYFSAILPCGMNITMTSVLQETGKMFSIESVARKYAYLYGQCFDFEDVEFEVYEKIDSLVEDVSRDFSKTC